MVLHIQSHPDIHLIKPMFNYDTLSSFYILSRLSDSARDHAKWRECRRPLSHLNGHIPHSVRDGLVADPDGQHALDVGDGLLKWVRDQRSKITFPQRSKINRVLYPSSSARPLFIHAWTSYAAGIFNLRMISLIYRSQRVDQWKIERVLSFYCIKRLPGNDHRFMSHPCFIGAVKHNAPHP